MRLQFNLDKYRIELNFIFNISILSNYLFIIMSCQDLISTIPSVSGCCAIFILILNIFLPGVGTLVLACIGPSIWCGNQILAGIFQILLAPLIIGWIWSIYWGILVLGKSGELREANVIIMDQRPPQVIVISHVPENNYPYNNPYNR